MTDQNRRHVDGNMLGGPMDEIFAGDLTGANERCVNCGLTKPMAALRVYSHAPGWSRAARNVKASSCGWFAPRPVRGWICEGRSTCGCRWRRRRDRAGDCRGVKREAQRATSRDARYRRRRSQQPSRVGGPMMNPVGDAGRRRARPPVRSTDDPQ